jgi:SAM-dependent methyltransferase
MQQNRVHEVHFPIPKPSREQIHSMCTAFFDLHSDGYDDLDNAVEKRRLYTAKVNSIVASYLSAERHIRNVFSYGCGTGRREKEIGGSLRTHNVEIAGFEPSAKMARLAADRGIVMLSRQDFEKMERSYDACLVLHSFSHLPDVRERKIILDILFTALRPGGLLILDAFNIDERDGWGAEIRTAVRERQLLRQGYEMGDAFYRRKGTTTSSFLHHFCRAELDALLLETGFTEREINTIGYTNATGELNVGDTEGIFLCICKKPAGAAHV